jgi:hypothetical protein
VEAKASERRGREAQREAVERLLPNPHHGSVLRSAGGEVLVYDETGGKLDPVNLRAVVMPDGSTRTFETGRFLRLVR